MEMSINLFTSEVLKHMQLTIQEEFELAIPLKEGS